jgi:uroporphyrinogen-III synthase
LALLYRISGVVSSARSLDEILDTLIRLAVSVTRCDACLLFLCAGDELVLRASQLNHSDEIGQLRLRPGEGVAGWVFQHRSVVALQSNAFEDDRFKKFPSLVEDTYQAFLSAPLMTGGEVIGVINIHHRNPYRHSADEIALVLFLGEQMGGAIARARLEEEKLEMQRRLETRKLVERAKGILQHTCNLTEEEAYLKLRNESRRCRRSMHELAQAVILSDGLARDAKER